MQKILLVASTTGYQVREFHNAARSLRIELVLATDRCHVLENPWGDDAASVRFEEPSPGVAALQARGPFEGVIAVGDTPAKIAAEAAELLGLRFHPLEAVRAASDKFAAREKFRAAGLAVPAYRLVSLHEDPAAEALRTGYPCVLKPLHLSASRGVIRANSTHEFQAAFERIRTMLKPEREESLLVEDFIPGKEFAVEGVMTGGRFQLLALFDKPDPLDGPFFEETLYITPSRLSPETQSEIVSTVDKAVHALGLKDGPVHAEVRVNERGVWILEAAARPIGGLCARVLKFRIPGSSEDIGFEELLLRHALGQEVSDADLSLGAHGVMMIPIPRSGVYQGAGGVEESQAVAGIEDVVLTAKQGQILRALPEGATYLGFIFARGSTAQQVEQALRRAHAGLRFRISEALPVAIVR
jgi:biotin carboxylase